MACFCSLVSNIGIFCLLALANKDGWTCESDGYWYQNGVKSQYANCNQKKDDSNQQKDDNKQGKGDVGCSVTTDPGMPDTLDRTCIAHSSSSEGRCWWTSVPQGVTTARRVPLVLDMHGGGGCASHQYLSSGFKELSDLEAANAGGGMILVWPQGGSGGLWASHGTQNLPPQNSKSLPTWDDIDFLEKLIAFMVKSSTQKDVIDPERIYVSGFSLGCMMSHRFSMERSKIVAAFGCHGGELSFYPTSEAEMRSYHSAYDIQAMPVYISIGDKDTNWFPGAQRSWQAWAYWNDCTSNSTKSVSATFQEHVASSCMTYTPTLETVMLVIRGGPHAPDPVATKESWSFLKRYKRSGVLDKLPAAPSETRPTGSPASSAVSCLPGKIFVCLLGCAVMFQLGFTAGRQGSCMFA